MSPWLELLPQLTAPAIVVAWSPFKIVPALVLVLHSRRPITTALAFLITSLIGLAAVTAVFIRMPYLLDTAAHGPTTLGPWAAPAVIGAGVGLVALAVLIWSRRGRSRATPTLLSKISHVTPAGAVAVGVVLSLSNPKVIAMNALAGVAIGAASFSVGQAALAVIFYTAIAGSTMAIPIVGYILAAERVDGWLVRIRTKIRRHQAALTSLTVAVIGLGLVAAGIRGLRS